MNTLFSGGALSTALLVLSCLGGLAPASAQQQAPRDEVQTLEEVVVTGNPLGKSELIKPAVQYSGAALSLRSQSTLGELLSNTPGVSSTYFGPNASRPIIRGLDGDRIRILGNGGASLDASGVSYDHAIAIDPITIDRVEVLRGPSALLYGGNAVGGVVNVVDRRIPREAAFDASGGLLGKVDLGLTTVNRGQEGAFLLEGGTDRYALHIDTFKRKAQDTRVPLALPCTQNGTTSVAKRICNSGSDSDGGALGGSLFFDKGFVGLSSSYYSNHYGTVAEDEATIRMRSRQQALAFEWRDLNTPMVSLKGRANQSNYEHTEFDAGVSKTTFRNKGTDGRLEARHAKLGTLEGVLGVQLEANRFSADGVEAFLPYTSTRSKALFAYEELSLPWGRLNAGGRLEVVSVDSAGNASVARFAVANRDFKPKSHSLGALVNLSAHWSATSTLSWSGRAPKDYELYADGPHLATGAYEIGNPAFSTERSSNLDLGVQWKSGLDRFALSAFANRFKNYTALEATGVQRDVDGNGVNVLPEYAYRQVRARFSGLEANGKWRLMNRTATLDMELRADSVRATNLDTNEPLPRIAPLRFGSTLIWTQGAWGARVGFDRSAEQTQVPAGQLTTAGYTRRNAALTYRMKANSVNALWFLRLDNVSNALAYSATSILTQSAPGKAPLPGRNVKAGVQISF